MVTLRTGQPCTGVVMGIRYNLDRPRTWISINSATIPDSSSDEAKVLSVFSDITRYVENERNLRDVSERLRRSNTALREAEVRLRTVVQTIPDMVWAKDLGGVYVRLQSEIRAAFQHRGRTDYRQDGLRFRGPAAGRLLS
jgi:PAS domain-containing protein